MDKELSVEELLRPRYKVIGLWPFRCHYKLGDIINVSENLEGATFFKTEVHKYPHLLRSLNWWEERNPNILPEYIEWYNPSEVMELLPIIFKVENWYSNPNTAEIAGVYVDGGNRLFIKDCKPATESEYLEYQKSKQG